MSQPVGPSRDCRERPSHLSIRLVPDDVTISSRPDETVLDAARRAGLRAPAACQRGGCRVCVAWLVEGSVRRVGGFAARQIESSSGDSRRSVFLAVSCRPDNGRHLDFKVGGRIPRTWAAWLRTDPT